MPVERFEHRLRHTVHRLRTGDNWTGASATQIVTGPKWVMLDLDSADRLADLVVAVREVDLELDLNGFAGIRTCLIALDEASGG